MSNKNLGLGYKKPKKNSYCLRLQALYTFYKKVLRNNTTQKRIITTLPQGLLRWMRQSDNLIHLYKI